MNGRGFSAMGSFPRCEMGPANTPSAATSIGEKEMCCAALEAAHVFNSRIANQLVFCMANTIVATVDCRSYFTL